MSWYEKYMHNLVDITTIDKLVTANKLTEEEKRKMIADRLAQYGY
ncbi:hypothetical protein [Anaerovorax sp. IOR16]|nr:hypothetical protein [Anaerovorax sp. IOR16]